MAMSDAVVDGTPFEYDVSLLRECATSDWASAVLLFPGSSIDDDEAAAAAAAEEDVRSGSRGEMRTDSAADEDVRSDGGGEMRAVPGDFYDGTAGDGTGHGDDKGRRACRVLFERHAAHYGRPLASLDEKAERRVSKRMTAFVKSVVFVHEHNDNKDSLLSGDGAALLLLQGRTAEIKQRTSPARRRHEVTLNQFSDLSKSELPLMDHPLSDVDWTEVFGGADAFLDGGDDGDAALRSGGADKVRDDNTGDRPVYVKLEDESTVRRIAEAILSHRSHLHGGHRHRHSHRHHPRNGEIRKELDRIPELDHREDDDASDEAISGGLLNHYSQTTSQEEDGMASRRRRRRDERLKSTTTRSRDGDDGDDGDDAVSKSEGDYGILDDAGLYQDFDTHLDWSTEQNPDGVPIVHEVIDQGKCGSCWAFAATGTLEASISRRSAYRAYNDAVRRGDDDDRRGHKNSDRRFRVRDLSRRQRDEAVAIAQQAEHDAFRRADLSAQELVDCDTEYDQGCTGGNPLLAFYFIHRYGLTSSDLYPYKGEQGTCHVHRVKSPVATVESWGMLTPNHEANMERVLRYIGPVAVGINGGDPEFLAYRGGIFDSPGCGQNADHAMLITGYGEERDDDGYKTKYWIARNTWGTGWGENGYVRIKRGNGKKGREGVCGIARSPSVALGGSLLNSASALQHRSKNEKPGSEQSMFRETHTRCAALGFNEDSLCARIERNLPHLAYLAAFVGAVIGCFFAVRQLVRRKRRHYQQIEQGPDDAEVVDGNLAQETSSLLGRINNQQQYV